MNSITLDTPEKINAWVLLSRVSQCHLHMQGLKVPGLHKWLVTHVPDCKGTRTVKDAYPRLLDYLDTFDLSAPGGERCHYQVLLTPTALNGLYFDQGIVSTMADVEANPTWVDAYRDGRLIIIRTMDEVRERDSKIQMVKDA